MNTLLRAELIKLRTTRTFVALAGIRNQVGAVVAVLAGTFVLEPIVLTTVGEVGRFGPFVALPTAASGIDPAAVGLDEVGLLDPELATLALLGWTGLAIAAGAVLLLRRDVES